MVADTGHRGRTRPAGQAPPGAWAEASDARPVPTAPRVSQASTPALPAQGRPAGPAGDGRPGVADPATTHDLGREPAVAAPTVAGARGSGGGLDGPAAIRARRSAGRRPPNGPAPGRARRSGTRFSGAPGGTIRPNRGDDPRGARTLPSLSPTVTTTASWTSAGPPPAGRFPASRGWPAETPRVARRHLARPTAAGQVVIPPPCGAAQEEWVNSRLRSEP